MVLGRDLDGTEWACAKAFFGCGHNGRDCGGFEWNSIPTAGTGCYGATVRGWIEVDLLFIHRSHIRCFPRPKRLRSLEKSLFVAGNDCLHVFDPCHLSLFSLLSL